MISIASIIAVLAPLITCTQLLPQLYKTAVTKKVDDLSIQTLLLIFASSLLWFMHGYFIGDYSLLISCSFTMMINATIITLYFQYSKSLS
jgi:uncharacterized protein with PQ loop repeat